MFYYIVSKLPIISSITDGKFFRIFLIGTICYLILHAYLFSKSASESEIISKYRHYLYYIWLSDFAFTGIVTKLFDANTGADEEAEENVEEEFQNNMIIPLQNQTKNSQIQYSSNKKLDEHQSSGQKEQSIFAKKEYVEQKQLNIQQNNLPDNKLKEIPPNDEEIDVSEDEPQQNDEPENVKENEPNISDTELPVYKSKQPVKSN